MEPVNCKLNIPKVEGLEDQLLTVGRQFTLACDGAWDKQFDFTKAQLMADGLQPEMAQVFQAQAVDLAGFEVDATLYVAAKIPAASFKLKDGTIEILLNTPELQIQSVLPPPQQGSAQTQQEPPKPYGFLLGDMAWPQIYFIIAAVFVIFIVGFSMLTMSRRRYWRKLENDLRNYDSPMTPEGQAYRQLRQLEKNGYDFVEFKRLIYLYILRRYQTPIFELKQNNSKRKLNSYLKSKWPRLKSQRRQIFHFINDLDVLERLPAPVQVENSKKIIRRFYDFVENSEDYFHKNKTEKETQP